MKYKTENKRFLPTEMAKTASELRIKMGKLKTKTMEETEQRRTERLHTLSRDSSRFEYSNGNGKLYVYIYSTRPSSSQLDVLFYPFLVK